MAFIRTTYSQRQCPLKKLFTNRSKYSGITEVDAEISLLKPELLKTIYIHINNSITLMQIVILHISDR